MQDRGKHLPGDQYRARERAQSLFDRMGINTWEVIEVAKTKPLAFLPFLPRTRVWRTLHPDRPFLPHMDRAQIRDVHPLHRTGRRDQHCDARLRSRQRVGALNDRGKPVKGSKITLLGVAYKKDVNDPRESPGLELMELLLKKGAIVSSHRA